MSLAGSFLVAQPSLIDPNFRQSVVLILAHSEEGAFGLIVNRPVPKPALVAALPADGPWSPSDQRPVYFHDCGTVQTPIYRREELAAGTRLVGPVIVEEVDSTILVHPGQHLTVEESGVVSIHVPRERHLIGRTGEESP